MSSRPVEVLVVGAGVVGSAVAFELASRGRRVTVLDMRRPGGGASRASAGILAPWVEGHHSEALRALGLRSLGLFEPFIARLAEHAPVAVEFRRAGTLEVAVDAGHVERLRVSSATAEASGVAVEWLDDAAAREAEPTLGPHVIGALRIPSHALVNVPAFTAASVAAAEALGATFVDRVTVTGVDVDETGPVVQTTEGDRRASAVVVAAGSWSRAVSLRGAMPAPVGPVRGQLLELHAPPATMHHVVWGADVYLAPWSTGAIYVGATSEDVGFDERTTAAGVSGLLASTLRLCPALSNATFVEARVGLRPGTPDSLPLVGPSTVSPGVIYACGHFRNGALLSPLTAALVANAVDGDLSDPAFASLTPARAGRL